MKKIHITFFRAAFHRIFGMVPGMALCFLLMPAPTARADAEGEKLFSEVRAKVLSLPAGTFHLGEAFKYSYTFQRPNLSETNYGAVATVSDGKTSYQVESIDGKLLVSWMSPVIERSFYLTGDVMELSQTGSEHGPGPVFSPTVDYVIKPSVEKNGEVFRVLELRFTRKVLNGETRENVTTLFINSDNLPMTMGPGKFTPGFNPKFDVAKLDMSRVPTSAKAAKKFLRPGDQIDDYTFVNAKGENVALSSLWKKNKATVVSIISPYCWGCHLELAYLAYLHERLGSKGLGTVAITGYAATGDNSTLKARTARRGAFAERLTRLYHETLMFVEGTPSPNTRSKDALPSLPDTLDYPLLFDPAFILFGPKQLIAMSEAELALSRTAFRMHYQDDSADTKNLTFVVDNQGKVIYVLNQFAYNKGFSRSFRTSLLNEGIEAQDLPVMNPEGSN